MEREVVLNQKQPNTRKLTGFDVCQTDRLKLIDVSNEGVMSICPPVPFSYSNYSLSMIPIPQSKNCQRKPTRSIFGGGMHDQE